MATGAGAVPVSYRYDALGRMTNLVDGQGSVTAFAYDTMGRLNRKTYADSTFYVYGYNARGWLTNRVDALGRATGYAYSPAGELTRVDYPTDTDVTYAFDNLGRMTGRVDAAGTWAWTYLGESSRVLSESLSASSALSAVSYSYASNTLDLLSVATAASTTRYAWACGRLTNVAWQAGGVSGSAAYAYPSNSDLLAATVYSQAGLTVTRLYDDADRLTNIAATGAAGAINSFGYTLDAVGRRVRRQDADNSRIDWDYDDFDQLTSAARTNGSSGAADAAYRFGYQYDLVGNRTNEQRGQLALVGAHNELNQLTARDWSGLVDVYGTVLNTAIVVVVNGVTSAPPYLTGRSWLGGATSAAGTNAVSVVGWLAGSNTLGTNFTVYMPTPKPQAFQYDANGNLTNDGQRAFYWDQENRLAAIEVSKVLGYRNRIAFTYDAQSRRIRSTEYAWNIVYADWTETASREFVYDGWNVLAEYAETSTPPHAETNFLFWGLDLSQSLQGAGGIGGLLCILPSSGGAGGGLFPVYDGNGNVADLVDSTGSIAAHYEYDPFGRTVAQSGPLAAENRWRFSSKWCEEAWGLYYYGYRWYSADHRRWASRDPNREVGSMAMRVTGPIALRRRGSVPLAGAVDLRNDWYLYLANDPLTNHDPLGLEVIRIELPVYKNPCRAIGLSQGFRGSLVCHQGAALGCVWPENWESKKLSPEVLACAQAHEDVHVKGPIDPPCDACRIHPYLHEARHEPDPKKQAARRLSVECPAYRAMQDCFVLIAKTDQDGYGEMGRLLEKWRQECKGTEWAW